MDIDALLASYPRQAPPLPPEYAKVYAEQYKINREGASALDGAAQKLEEWMHRQVASCEGGPVLELGAGTLNHMKFEAEGTAYDVVEPFTSLYEGQAAQSRVRRFYASSSEVPANERYRRIISIAVLEHLTELPTDVARSALMLEEGGVFQAGIPTEGGFLWWAGWRFGTGIGYWLRTRLDYGVVMRHEHVNNAEEIVAVVRHFFADVRLKRFPTPLHALSFYTYVEARSPRLDVARAWLERASS